jgi:hypothetical protein
MVPRIPPSPSSPSQPPITHSLSKITPDLCSPKLPLCFDNDMNCSPRNPFSLITIQNALPYTPASPPNHHPEKFSPGPEWLLTRTFRMLYSIKAAPISSLGSCKPIPATSSTGILVYTRQGACARLMPHPGARRIHQAVPLRPAPRTATIASRSSPRLAKLRSGCRLEV